ncbi:hypothetical protein L1049_024567 [Liquidambar formosana]|uniref:Pentatricopeptide repeat-containing protein n=1 Tax=Liquidambar formosana TaxID=63359 RepID=A0AAP0S0U0_LIQFO
MHGLYKQAKLQAVTRAAFTSIRFFLSQATFMRSHRDSYDYTYLLQHCIGTKSIKQVHAQIIIGGFEQNPFVATKLVGKYTECSDSNMVDARKVFDCLWDRDVFMWNMVIQGYANLGPFVEALNVYVAMRGSGVSANRYTYPFVLKACGAMKDRRKGQVIHGQVVKSGFDSDVFVGNALVAFYAKCQEVETSRRVFDGIPQKDIVTWNSMISGYTVNGYADEALVLFHAMLKDETIRGPDSATLVGVLPACVQEAATQEGLWIHSYIIKSGMEVDAALGSGLISMYANCGRLKSAQDVFDRISDKNIVVWNAMIRCYGMHGHADEALKMFSELVEIGLRPDSVIFLCLLSTCSHAGKVAKGWELFERMGDYGIEKNDQHYACMVDLLGRAGFLGEAVEFIKTMPVRAGKDVYGALLGACRIHNNIELAEEVAGKLFVMDPDNAGRYIILAKMYEDVGRWEDAATMRKTLGEKKIRKPFGCSSIEVDCVRHTFGVEDESHPFTEQIFDTLERLDRIMEKSQ